MSIKALVIGLRASLTDEAKLLIILESQAVDNKLGRWDAFVLQKKRASQK